MSTSGSDSVPRNANPSDNTQLWDVQAILAARTSVSGDDEVLVVWKPSWIPMSNVCADGPVMLQFKASTKWTFTSAICGMRTILPVEPETTLAVDHAVMTATAKAAKAERHASNQQTTSHPTGPRKALGGITKAARITTPTQAKQRMHPYCDVQLRTEQH